MATTSRLNGRGNRQLLDLLYSTTLLAALTAGALSLTAGLVALVRTWHQPTGVPESSLRQRLCQAATSGALVSVAFAIVSIGVHILFGHRPGSAEGLGPVAFFAIHPAYLGTSAMAALAALFSRLARARQAERTEESCS